MVVIVYVEQRITPGLLVYGDERSHNSSAMVITEPGYTLIRPKYNSLLVRLPADKWYHSDHRFGLWITEGEQFFQSILASISASHLTNFA
nr:unnamed protein product [Fasciola hepatica]